MWEHPVLPVHPTEVPHARSHTMAAVRQAWQGLCVTEGEVLQCQQVGILFCKHPGAVSCHTLTHVRQDKALQLTEKEEKTRAVVHVYGQSQSQVCTRASVPWTWGRAERGGAATQEQHVLCQGGDLVPTDVILIYSQTSNINQIFLYSVINVNHKTIKVLSSQ